MVPCGVHQNGFPAGCAKAETGGKLQASLSLSLETKACPFPSGSSGSDYLSNLPSFLKPFTCSFIHVFIRSFIYSFILVYFTGSEFSSIHFHLFPHPTGI